MNLTATNSSQLNRFPGGFDKATIDSLVIQCAPNQLALLRLLAVSHQQKIELLPLLCSLGMELFSFDRGRISELSAAVESGTPYIEALSLTKEILPKNCVLAIQLADHENSLSEFFAAILAYGNSLQLTSYNSVESEASRIIRFAFRTLFVGLSFTWISLTILPQLSLIISEYGIEAPPTLLVLNEFLEYGYGFFWIGIPVLFLILTPLWFNLGHAYLRTWNPMHWKRPIYSKPTKARTTLAILNPHLQGDLANDSRRLEILNEAMPQAGEPIWQTPLDSNLWQELENKKILSKREAQALKLASNTATQSWLLRWSGKKIQQAKNRRRSFFIHWFITSIDVCIALFIIAVFNTVFLYYLEIIAAAG